MQLLFCRRCQMEVPMLNEEEFETAQRLCAQMFDLRRSGRSREDSSIPILEYYKELTGFDETEPNAIMHHRLSLYGPACESCGKPYRTPNAMLCAACGHKRSAYE